MNELKFSYQKVNKEKIIDDLMDDTLLRNFFLKHDLTSEQIENDLLTFLSFKVEQDRCQNCQGLSTCTQDNKGHQPVLVYKNKQVIQYYKECQFMQQRIDMMESQEHINAMHLPSSIYQANFDDFDFGRGENKTLVQNKLISFISQYVNGQTPKGLYLHGPNGVGKTYVLSALANELMRRKIDVVIAYYPDLVREFKSRVGDNTVEGVISQLKQVSILILDDIGGESNSVWIRDEVLGPILQYRLLDNKPTFFSSNYTLKQLLEEHFARFSKETDNIKALRIAKRIKELTLNNEIKM